MQSCPDWDGWFRIITVDKRCSGDGGGKLHVDGTLAARTRTKKQLETPGRPGQTRAHVPAPKGQREFQAAGSLFVTTRTQLLASHGEEKKRGHARSRTAEQQTRRRRFAKGCQRPCLSYSRPICLRCSRYAYRLRFSILAAIGPWP